MPSPRQVQFLADLKRTLEHTNNEMVKLALRCDEFRYREREGTLTSEYVNTEVEELEGRMKNIRDDGGRKAHELISKRLEELEAADALDPKMLSPDAELLRYDFLDQHDIDQMVMRNSGNPTMARLILKYADAHGLHVTLPSHVVQLSQDKKATKDMEEVVRVALKWAGDVKNGQAIMTRLFAGYGV